MKRSKALLTLLCAAALVVTSVFGTMAYLTDDEAATNTFTVGRVHIKLDEADTDDSTPDKDRDQSNKYHLLPGHKYDKDPMVTVLSGSEASYVRMLMTVHNASAVQAIIDADDKNGGKGDIVDYADLFEGWQTDKWLYEDFEADAAANTITFEFRYYTTTDGYVDDDNNAETPDVAKDVALEPLFTKLVVPGYVTNEQIAALYGDLEEAEGDFVVTVVAEAIQAAGFEGNEDAAWIAFDAQN